MSSVRQLAELLALSPTTVSAALRGNPSVTPATRERVRQAAEQIGYRPNPLASALMSEMRRSRNGVFRGILVLLHLDDSEDPRRQAIVAGATRRAAELGFKTDQLVAGKNGCDAARLNDILAARGVSGVLALPSTDKERLAWVDWTRYPALYAGIPDEHTRLHAVCADYYSAMETTLHRLHALGHARPGLVLHADIEPAVLARWKAAYCAFFLDQPARAGRSARRSSPPFPFIHSGAPGDEAAFRDWLQLGDHDAVIADSAIVREWTGRAPTRAARPLPFFHLSLDPATGPHLFGGVDLRLQAVGAKGIDLLADQILRDERGQPEQPLTTLCPIAWHPGRVQESRVAV